MTEPRETAFNYFAGDATGSFSSQDYAWVRKIEKLAAAYPGEVDIRARNQDGSICARLPVSWFKIQPPRKSNLTDEQRKIVGERLRQGREARAST